RAAPPHHAAAGCVHRGGHERRYSDDGAGARGGAAMMGRASSRGIALFADASSGVGGLLDATGFFLILLPLVAVFVLIGLAGVIVGLTRGKEAFWLGLVCACPSALCAVISLVSLIIW